MSVRRASAALARLIVAVACADRVEMSLVCKMKDGVA
jgi:hypothetical protein